MSNVTQFPGAYTYTLEANPSRTREIRTNAIGGERQRPEQAPVKPTVEPMIRADVVDATHDAYMIARLVRDYGCSKRDIANTFGASGLGKCAPIWFDAALVATLRSKWSAL